MANSNNEDRKVSLGVVWNIRHFSCYSWDEKEAFRSPIFNSSLNLWQLWLRPLRKKDEIYISVYFGRLNAAPDLTLDYKLEILTCDASPIVVNENKNWELKKSGHFAIPIHVGKDGMLDEWRKSVLSNDTFTIRCSVWNKEPPCFEKDMRFVTTTIGVEKKSFDWVIKDFSSLSPNKVVCRKVMSIMTPSMALKLFHLNDGVQIELSLKDRKQRTFVKCEISVATAIKDYYQKRENVFPPGKDEPLVLLFPNFISRSTLLQSGADYLPKGALTLRCTCTISSGIISEHTTYGPSSFHHLDRHGSNSEQGTRDSFREDMLRMYEEKSWCDFELRAQTGETFPVLRSILAARSPALRALVGFESNKKCIESVTIPDLSGETLNRMLMFAYADTAGDLDFESAVKLYFASDKYQLQTLKQRCLEFLKMNITPTSVRDVLDLAKRHQDDELQGLCLSFLRSSLNVSNACDVLMTADIHQNQELKKLVQDFVSVHDEEILHSGEWRSLLENRPYLAAQTLQQMYVKKVKLEPIQCKEEPTY